MIDLKEKLAYMESKRSDGYAAYMKATYEVAWNAILMPVWFFKDNGALFIRVFLATLMVLILFEYIGSIYAEWEMGTEAGKAAFLIMKVWFSYKLFQWMYPAGIVERAKESADRISEILETKSWLKAPNDQ